MRNSCIDAIEDEKITLTGQKLRWFNLNENRYKSEVKFMPNAYYYRMKARLDMIERVIDDHIKFLRDQIGVTENNKLKTRLD